MKGGCHCGAVRFEVTGDPTWIGVCYCSDCRKISGTPAMTYAEFEKKNLKITQGVPKEYASSKKVVRTFCGNCGSPISYTHEDYSDKVEMPVGAFDNLESFAPQIHIWTSNKPKWFIIGDNLPQREK